MRTPLVPILLAALVQPALADARRLTGAEVPVDGAFDGDKGKASKNISGIACRPEAAGARLCVVIDDQVSFAQVALLKAGTLIPGQRQLLIDEDKQGKIFGSPPADTRCPQNDPSFADLDGEGVAADGPYFYVVGSHGCSRKKGVFQPSTFVTARFRLDAAGQRLDKHDAPVDHPATSTKGVEATYRLADALRTAEALEPYYATSLGDAGSGLNIEGIAVVDGTLYAGLRAPSVDGKAFLIGAKVDELFAPGDARLAAPAVVVPLKLGEGVGIRDVARLGGDRLLLLTGPSGDRADIPFGLAVVTLPLRPGAMPQKIAELTEVTTKKDVRAKAEAVLPLDDGGTRAIVLFDGLKNGGPLQYELTPKP